MEKYNKQVKYKGIVKEMIPLGVLSAVLHTPL